MEDIKKTTEFLINALGFDSAVVVAERASAVYVNIQEENPVLLIGRHGETLDALQHMVKLMCNRASEESIQIVVDVNGYKSKRIEILEKRVRDIARKVRETGNEAELEPMNSYERMVVHTAVSGIADVETESRGFGRDRKIVIRPANANTDNEL